MNADHPHSVTPADIEAAARRIAGHVRHTPVLRLPGRTLGVNCSEIWLKLEHLQASGSFKARGMFNRMLAQPIPEAGVVIASGGNAGIAVATAAKALGVRCEVFLPEVSTPAKRQALAGLDAQVVVHGAAYADAYAACVQRQQASGALLMHAYDQAEVVAGAGIAAWFAGRCRVEALEPVGSPTLHAARTAGEPVDVSVGGLAADALGAKRIGSIAWAICQRHVLASHLVSDESIAAAQRLLWTELRLAVEPAAALGLAALRSGVVQPAAAERVALVLCGANFDPAALN